MSIENPEASTKTYTYNESWDRVPLASYEDFFQFLEPLTLIDGRYPLDEFHAFFIWLSREPKFQNIDGHSLVDIYERNVIGENMTIEDFLEWCHHFDIPVPTEIHGELTEYGKNFNQWAENETTRVENSYLKWAFKNGIDSSEDSVMRFIDDNAEPHYIVTDFENRGMIVG